ncbi:uncharacterized protein DS421_19g656450 [Arachis hypogaea]|uniref:Uncharacterized protein n=1 Tax=Arachis hypogaea TaxID=3818 RepID=A0A6B9VA04_ARAHY|nr:uncharacterized protein DS421_19g656450 [Arachis hypogaea]
MNRTRLRGKEIFVGEARFRRDGSKGKEVRVSTYMRKDTGNTMVNTGHILAKNGTLEAARVVDYGAHSAWSKDQLAWRMSQEPGREPQEGCSRKDLEAKEGMVVQASVVERNLDWMHRSLVGTTITAIDYGWDSEGVRAGSAQSIAYLC